MRRGFGLFNSGFAKTAGEMMIWSGVRVSILLLADQLYQYRTLKKTMSDRHMLPEKDQREEHNLVAASKKEWLILGRQSPGYVRDPNANAKDNLNKKIDMSSIVIKQLGAFLDNEEHYNLFEGSDFQVTLFSNDPNTPRIAVDHSKMASTELEDIPDNALFEVGFARKQGFTDYTKKIPLFHSSIALRMISDGETGNKDRVIMSGKEIKSVIVETNNVICEKQHCTMLTSNCYSASVFAMGEMIKIIDARNGKEEKKTADINNIMTVMSNAALDNYSVGVSNNDAVSKELSEITQIAAKHHLVTLQPEVETQAKQKM